MTHIVHSRLARAVLAPLALALCAQVQAQEPVAISPEDIVRMGVVFTPLEAADTSTGARVAATVVNSPDTAAMAGSLWTGTLSRWHAMAGDSVVAGALLATVRSQDVLPLQQAWISAVTALESADLALQRDETLFAQGVIAEQRLQQTRLAQQQAAFSERSARAQLAQGGFDAARLQALRERGQGLGEFYLLAPEAGVLSQRLHTAGDFVAAGETVATLNAGSQRWLSAHVPARMARDLTTGQRLSIAGSGETLTLRQMDYVIDSSNQTIELLAEFDAPSGLTTGQIVSLVLPPSAPGIRVPERAVVHSGSLTTVYVRTASGVEARTLSLRAIGADYLALDGLSAGEEVAIQGTAVLKGIQLGLGGGE
jgi:cobalt-zinc-cadmium efflux system membrane fusion protein